MSKMIPYRVVDTLRHFVDVSIGLYGINCELYIPNNLNDVDDLGVYVTPADITYDGYDTQVFIEWSPNIHRLRKLGIFTEDESPMIARFASKAIEKVTNNQVDVEIVQRSYIKVPMQYVPNNMDTDEFELVEVHVEGAHDAEVVKLWKMAPRRIKIEE